MQPDSSFVTEWLPSPNYDSREGKEVSLLVLHYTGMKTGQEAIDRLRDPQAKVSAHYVVEEDGKIFQLVPELERAWHAGVSFWRGISGVNAVSIGVEIVNPGHEFGYRPFPEMQMQAVEKLCADIVQRHNIEPPNVVAHSDVAPDRKEDPGELFDWQRLAGHGVGIWPEAIEPCSGAFSVASVQKNLADFGYNCLQTGVWDEATRKVIIAFQRRFRQSKFDGLWDGECEVKLNALMRLQSY